jgi:c-di-GMP-binding flagellar brake protein YcgR
MIDGLGERRKHKRYDVEGVRGNVHYLSDLNIMNISVDGAAIETTKRLEVNREYRFKIDYKGTPLCVKGLVVWSQLIYSEKKQSGELIPVYRSGVKFIDIMDKKANTLLSFIEENKMKTSERRLGGVRCKITAPQHIKVGYPYGYDVKKISLSGMEIETEHPFDPASMHNMELLLNEKVLNITGRIINCVEGPSENFTKYSMGVEFVEISEEDRVVLESFLDTLDES